MFRELFDSSSRSVEILSIMPVFLFSLSLTVDFGFLFRASERANGFHFLEKHWTDPSADIMICIFKKAVSLFDSENKEPHKREPSVQPCDEAEDVLLKDTIYDIIKTIKDPERPQTLEDLLVVYEDGITINHEKRVSETTVVRVEFNPTIPHCSLATLIGLCIRVKLQRCLPQKIKLDIYIKKGAHDTEDEINKQVNDKERIAAAMENHHLRKQVENCIQEEE